jgi:hypothetical protein
MSRRNHHSGRHHGRPHKVAERRPAAPSTLAPGDPPETIEAAAPADIADRDREVIPVQQAEHERFEPAPPAFEPAPWAPESDPLSFEPSTPPAGEEPTSASVAYARPTNGEARADVHVDTGAGTCTAPQLRRFIKSRAYVPMHELRRRFAINGSEDDVTQVDVNAHRIYIGLPVRVGRLLGELLRGGDVGFELSLDPISPIVVGVYPMRPVPRP